MRLHYTVDLSYQVEAPGADFIFNIQAARTRQQRVVNERLDVGRGAVAQTHTDATTQARYLRLQCGATALRVQYEATVDITHHQAQPRQLAEAPVASLPAQVLTYLYPSRYCESDRLQGFAVRQFGHLPQGYARVMAIRDWVNHHVAFRSNSSSGTTSACDTLAAAQGVCRDFAHLMIALCRALNIPARFSTGLDYGADPALGPPDFHAYVEAWLGDRWFMFDPSGTALPMGFVRIATSHDAADAAFATLFGPVMAGPPVVTIRAVPDERGVLQVPQATALALSTDDGRV